MFPLENRTFRCSTKFRHYGETVKLFISKGISHSVFFYSCVIVTILKSPFNFSCTFSRLTISHNLITVYTAQVYLLRHKVIITVTPSLKKEIKTVPIHGSETCRPLTPFGWKKKWLFLIHPKSNSFSRYGAEQSKKLNIVHHPSWLLSHFRYDMLCTLRMRRPNEITINHQKSNQRSGLAKRDAKEIFQ